jgi:hypothetical protein
MKKILLIGCAIFALAAVVAGVAYLYLPGRDFSLRLSEAQLQEKLSAKLPVSKTYLLVIKLTLENPKVHLLNGSDRVRMGLDVVLNLNVGGEAKPLGGKIEVSGAVAYVPESAQFFLINPVVENLSVQGIPQKYAERVTQVLSKALTAYYAEHPVYQFTSTDAKWAAAKLILKSVKVENQQLVLHMGI